VERTTKTQSGSFELLPQGENMKIKDIFMYALGALIVIGFFAIVVMLIMRPELKDSLNLVIGALIGAFGTVVGYFYGSSKGSAEKNEIIAK